LELTKNLYKNQQNNKDRGSFADGLAAGLEMRTIAFRNSLAGSLLKSVASLICNLRKLTGDIHSPTSIPTSVRPNRAHRRRGQRILSKNQSLVPTYLKLLFRSLLARTKKTIANFEVTPRTSSAFQLEVETESSSLTQSQPQHHSKSFAENSL
jgi:hypothetical protein